MLNFIFSEIKLLFPKKWKFCISGISVIICFQTKIVLCTYTL